MQMFGKNGMDKTNISVDILLKFFADYGEIEVWPKNTLLRLVSSYFWSLAVQILDLTKYD